MNTADLPKLTNKNFRRYLRTYVPEIPIEELEHIYRRGGDSIAFRYGENRILKLARNDQSREAMRLEFELLSHLHQYELSVELPELVMMQEDGLYTVYTRIDGDVLTPETIASFSPDQQASFARSIGRFLSFLHTHEFPQSILDLIPVEDDTFDVVFRRSLRKIEVINNYLGGKTNTDGWESSLRRLHGSMHLDLAVTHCDLTCDHLFSSRSDRFDFAIIDFADTLIHDKYVDLNRMELPPDLLRMVVEHYEPETTELDDRIEFRQLAAEINRVYKQVKKGARRSSGASPIQSSTPLSG